MTQLSEGIAPQSGIPGPEDPYMRMIDMICGASIVQIVRCAAMFSLADHAAKADITARHFAEAEKLDPDTAARFLRACAACGLLTANDGGSYSSTPLLATLRSQGAHSLRDLALVQGGPGHWLPWGRFEEALRTGRDQAEATLGAPVWDYYASASGLMEGRAFSGAMSGANRDIDAAARLSVDTSGIQTAVDVGGASGSLLRELMQTNPSLRGIVLDLPKVIDHVCTLPECQAMGGRLTFVAGSFLETIPAGDLYLLRHILHDWGDQECRVILRNCRQSARAGSRLLVIEQVMGSQPSKFACQVDLTMLVAVSGRERQLKEYEHLLGEAGFTLRSIKPLTATHSLIEAVAS
jgi:O-methyltransferase